MYLIGSAFAIASASGLCSFCGELGSSWHGIELL